MRSKQKLVLASVATLAASAVLFGSCAFGKTDPGRFFPKDKTTAEFSAGDLQTLSDLTGADVLSVDSLGLAVVQTSDVYFLRDLTENVASAKTTSPFVKVSDGLYLVKAEGKKNALYYRAEAKPDPDKKTDEPAAYILNVFECTDGDAANGVYVTGNGVRYYLNAAGKFTEEKNPVAPILTYAQAQNAIELKDFYLLPDGNSFVCFEKTGEYYASFDLYNTFDFGADDEIRGFWYVKNTLYLQTTRPLPSENKSYDLFYQGEKLDLHTYAFDMENKHSKELIAFDFLVTGAEGVYDEYAILRGRDVNDRRCGEEILQTFDESGNVYVDLQKLFPGTTGFFTEGYHVYLTNNAGTAMFFNSAKRYEGKIYSDMTGFVNGCGYYYESKASGDGNLYVYDNEGALSVSLTDIVEYGATPDGRIYYVQNAGENYSVYVYGYEKDEQKKNKDAQKQEALCVVREVGYGRYENGFYICPTDGKENVFALFGDTPSEPIIEHADENSVTATVVPKDGKDIIFLTYTLSGVKQYSLVTLTNAYDF